MEIYAKENDKIVYKNINSGHEHDQKEANKYLIAGNIYTVDYTHVESFHTDVYIKEVPNISFNSVMFEDVNDEEIK
jgi:hypothetical protein